MDVMKLYLEIWYHAACYVSVLLNAYMTGDVMKLEYVYTFGG
jgi:hypothetical protein